MNTAALKRFATAARLKIKSGVVLKLMELGFDGQGNVPDDIMPQRIQGATLFRGQYYPESMYQQWNNLYSRVQNKGIQAVYEEVAYTWFNRIVAIRILQKNALIQPVLQFVEGFTRMPQIVFDAKRGRYPEMTTEERMRMQAALQDENRVVEQFSILLTAFCHSNPILNNCFGKVADYSELLLPNDILADGGFIDMLNQTDYITDDDYKTTELLGWLYQFYISERKDEVFASFKSGKKAAAEDIPAATQIFTPNWIVKYMVQNTIGRIYLDNEPYSDLKSAMPYLVESDPTPRECQFRYTDLAGLTMVDPACGSGHILLEGFELYMKMYQEAGYTLSQSIELIFTKNLLGIELDTRAKQLSMFALLLKACQYDRSFADAHVLPRVLDMPNVDVYTWRDLGGHMACAFQMRTTETINRELDAAFMLLKQADNLGSIMRFNISSATHSFMQEALKHIDEESRFTDDFGGLAHGFRLILALTDKYAAVVANPPYMGAGNMNAELSQYVKDNYDKGKADLFSVFMLLSANLLLEKGKYGMINMHSWMFLSSFESLRKSLLNDYQIDSLLHLGPRTFDELSGEVVQNVAFVITRYEPNVEGTYFRLVDGKNCSDKEHLYLESQKLNGITFSNISQKNFDKIPGCPIGYWVSEKMIGVFDKKQLDVFCRPAQGMATSDNGRFLRSWHEVSSDKIGIGLSDSVQALQSQKKWFPYNKGGAFRKWYGNQEHVVNWENDGFEIRNFKKSVVRNPSTYFHKSISWSKITSGSIAFRMFPNGFIYDVAGTSLFLYNNDMLAYYLGLLNSNVIMHVLEIISPTLNYEVGQVASLPITEKNIDNVSYLSTRNIEISKQDWDAHETSWDFEQNELVYMATNAINLSNIEENPDLPISALVDTFKEKWSENFYQLHANEEELNRQFIEIYGLQDELTPDVPLNEITILQQGEISIEDNQIIWHEDVLMKQLISYIIGLIMGRYRLDKPGLHIAHPEPSSAELAPYTYNGKTIEIDDDSIIPILPDDSPFADNLHNRVKNYIRIIFGDDILTQNLNYIEQALSKGINDYLQKDFYADHKKMYQNRPIYWLFSSKKGAFRCLVYMHRMDAYTAEKVRSKYLLPYMEHMRQKIDNLRNNNDLTSLQRRELSNLQKAYEECQEYHERLHTVAGEQIAFDLDDGVVVNYAKFGDVLAKLK